MKRVVTAISTVFFSCSLLASAAQINDTSLVFPGCYTGSHPFPVGCSNVGFAVNDTPTTELGLDAFVRTQAATPDGGTDTYSVPAGTGSNGNATWDYTFSINTQAGAGGAVLTDYVYQLTLTDLDHVGDTVTFNPLSIADDDGFGPGGETQASLPAGDFGAQNSESFSFSAISIPNFDPNALDTYSIVLTEAPVAGGPVDDSVTIFVNATPEPASMALVAGGILAIGFIKRRRKSQDLA